MEATLRIAIADGVITFRRALRTLLTLVADLRTAQHDAIRADHLAIPQQLHLPLRLVHADGIGLL